MKSPKQTTGNQATARQYNSLRSDAAGGATLLSHQQLGAFTLPTNASNGNTLTLTLNTNPIVITLVSGTPTNANDVKIGATGTATAINIINFLQNPSANNANQVAASAANQTLLSYLGFFLPNNSTTLTVFSINNTVDAPFTAFTGSTSIAGGAWGANTLRLFIEPGIFYIGTTQVVFTGTASGAFAVPGSNPRIDLLCVGTASAVTIVQGSESATPAAPTYPTDKVVVAEVYNVVGQTEIRDFENQSTGSPQGYILKDTRPFNSIIYINDNAQIAPGVILQANLGNAGTVPTGTVISTALPTGTAVAGWLECTGTAVSRSTYATLFGAIGTTFGAGDGSTTFNLPDLRGRVPLGSGTGKGEDGSGTGTPTGTALSARAVGEWGGAEDTDHTHTLPSGNNYTGGASAGVNTPSNAATVNKMQPFLVLTFYIKT